MDVGLVYGSYYETAKSYMGLRKEEKQAGFAEKVTDKSQVSPEDMTLEEYKAYFNEKMNSSEEYHHTDPRPCKKKGWVVQCPGGISLCHHSDCNFTCSNLSGYDLSYSYNWRHYAFCFH